jgi:hypothetical protein
VLVLDEVLAVGDETFQRRCHQRIQQLRVAGCTTVYVTHALWTLPLLCERAAVLQSGRIVAEGTPSAMIEVYRRQDADSSAHSAVVTLRLSSASISPEDPLTVLVAIRPREDIATPHLLVSLTDSRGSIVAGWQIPATLRFVASNSYRLRFDLHAVTLHAGEYQVNACLTHGADDTVCESLVSHRLEVVGAPHNQEAFGQFILPASWSWDSGSGCPAEA